MRPLIVSGTILALAACSALYSFPVVDGTWGANRLELRGTSESFTVELSCAIMELTSPTVLTDDGHFHFEGRTRSGSKWYGNQPIVGTGQVRGDSMFAHMTIALTSGVVYVVRDDTLIRGRSADWVDSRSCLL
ncbi:MAG: hypothetical protein ABIZ70_03915 [Gemmatimonadales bacterium]